jgi:hypothetical protein
LPCNHAVEMLEALDRDALRLVLWTRPRFFILQRAKPFTATTAAF